MATIIRADGRVQEVTPANGSHFTLAELQAVVGGYIEAVAVQDRFMFVNEDGKHLGLPLNHEATARVRHVLVPGDVVVGDVIICSRGESNEEEEDEA
jgi:hypothetical protein